MKHLYAIRLIGLLVMLCVLGREAAAEYAGFQQGQPVLVVPATPFVFADVGGQAAVQVTNGGTGTLAWSAEANRPWVRVVSGETGVGAGVIEFAVEANDAPGPRSAVLTVMAAAEGSPVEIPLLQNGTSGGAPLAVAVTIPFDGALGAEQYRLVGLPGEIDTPLADVLPGTPDVDWTAYYDDGEEPYEPAQFDGSATFRFRPGRGFWVIGNRPLDVARSVPPIIPDVSGLYAIPLHPGWNIISNPFDADVAWDAVLRVNELPPRTLYRWDGQYAEESVFRSALQGEAYYFENREDAEALRIPYPGTEIPSLPEDLAPPVALTLSARVGDRPVAAVRVGQAPAASAGYDRYDQGGPPGYFEDVGFRLILETAPGTHRQLVEEFRPVASDGGQTYALRLTNRAGAPVSLRAVEGEALGTRAAIVFDTETGRAYDVRLGELAKFRSSRALHRLLLLVGTETYVAETLEKLRPAEPVLLESYPNPARTRATIRYALPAAGPVTLVVYDLMGREVATLVDGVVEAGYHDAVFDVHGVASGAYVYRLTAGSVTRSGRLLVLD